MKTHLIFDDKRIRVGECKVYSDKGELIGTIHQDPFSLRKKILIKDSSGDLVGYGYQKVFSPIPNWIIKNIQGETVGELKVNIMELTEKYTYKKTNGEIFFIEGNVWSRDFTIMNKVEEVVVKSQMLKDKVTNKEQPFSLEIKDGTVDLWECITLIQGLCYLDLITTKNRMILHNQSKQKREVETI